MIETRLLYIAFKNYEKPCEYFTCFYCRLLADIYYISVNNCTVFTENVVFQQILNVNWFDKLYIYIYYLHLYK